MRLSESLCAGVQELLVNKVKLAYHVRSGTIVCVFPLLIFKTGLFMDVVMSCNHGGESSVRWYTV